MTHTITALFLLAPFAFASPVDAQCAQIRMASGAWGQGTHIDSNDDAASSHLTYSRSDASHCASATIIGRLRYSEAEDDVVDVPPGAQAVFHEYTLDNDREVTITRGQSGEVLHTYRRNGVASEYDGDARRWLAGFLPTVLMEAGVNVGPRVARWRAQGGVENVLSHIGEMSSSGAKRSHYEQLLSHERLTDAELDNVVRQAGRTMQSSGDLRAVLERAAPSQGGGLRSGSALEAAAMHIASSGDRTSVLRRYGQTSDREMLLAVIRVARTIPSGGDKAGLLTQLVSRYLSGTDGDLHAAFFQTAVTVESSGDLRNVLQAAMPHVARSADMALLLIDAARSVASSGDRSDVLVSLANTGITNTPRVREAFLNAAESVPSMGDRTRVLEAAARRQ